MTSLIRGRESQLRPRELRTPAAALDTTVPALVVKVGQYPVASGVLGAVRTLGRAGVRVFALTEPGLTPAGVSRYCTGRFTWRATSADDMGAVANDLHAIGRRIGNRSLIVPLDDESAVVATEHAEFLSEHFILPPVSANLPRRLASKAGLRELSQQHGVPAPMSAAPSSAREVADFAVSATFPVVAKNAGVWDSRNATRTSLGSSSSGPRLIYDAAELASLTIFDGPDPSFVVQEYIPPESSEDWIVHLYADSAAECQVLFTGRKVRSWPLGAGVTACGVSAANPTLAEAAQRFCKAIGYCGVADMDWRLDRRDGQYKLLDFNPRVGNNFRLFVNEFGVDVVHALHLDMTGRPVPQGAQVDGRRLVVEHIDIPSRLAARAYAARGPAVEAAPRPAAGRPAPRAFTSTEYAWYAADDPLPLLGMLSRVVSLYKIVRRGIRLLRASSAYVPTAASTTTLSETP